MLLSALNLWTIEIAMQMRIYALYGCSRKLATFNFALFLISIAVFLLVVIRGSESHYAEIANVIYPLFPGCPTIHASIDWAQWVPATVYERILFLWVAKKTLQSMKQRRDGRQKLCSIAILNHCKRQLFIFSQNCLFNTLMLADVTKIPWISYCPFHAAMEIMTSRMLINLYEAHERTKDFSLSIFIVEISTQLRVALLKVK